MRINFESELKKNLMPKLLSLSQKKIADFRSECLILDAVENDAIMFLKSSCNMPNGLKIS